jgi:hypothetical protein
MNARLGLLFSIAFIVSSCGRTPVVSKVQERWDEANDPINMLPKKYAFIFSKLPLEGEILVKPWADTYWPSKQGGLSQRWLEGVDGHNVKPVQLSAAKDLSKKELAGLSPAEKFDLFVEDESQSLFNNEVNRTSPNDGAWFGICHGWAPASLAWAEPKAVMIKNASGLEIPFASSDIKALLSLYSADYARTYTKFLASRCNEDIKENPESALSPECRDTNAGAFHLVLTNLLGLQKVGFVADVTRDLEVWNQPVSGFKTTIVSESLGRSRGAARGTVKEVIVETEMYYGQEIQPKWSVAGANIFSKTYNYRLELSKSGKIVGGAWISEDRPDFLWSKTAPVLRDTSASYSASIIKWSKLQEIYDASMSAETELENLFEGM